VNHHEFREGMKAATPIVLGYLPVAIAFGVLARGAGVSSLEVGLMSLLVYAGASQFVAVEMISKGMVWFPIVLTTFFLNLRHLLMSSTFSLHFRKVPLRIVALLSAQLTDESFAMAMADPSKIANRPSYVFGLQMISQCAWVVGTVIGAFFGGLINQEGYGIPFALPSLLICLLVLQIKSSIHLGMMILSGVLSLLFRWALPGNWYIVLTAVAITCAGTVIEMLRRRE
jgi:4-azaleucine resistance transporter AzlC